MKKIIHFKKIGSTQNYATKNAEKYSDLTIIVADRQTGGRGQFNRKWHSPAGGLYFSIILKPKNIKPDALPILTYALALSIADAIKKISGLKPELKWPNDVVIRGKWEVGSRKWKKLAGILTESCLGEKSVKWVAISAGINVNNKIPESLGGIAVSIADLTGKKCDKKNLLKEILKNFGEYYPSFPRFEILKKYTQKSMLIGKKTTMAYAGEKYAGRVTGFNQNGAIEMSLRGNIKKTFYSGEVTVPSF